MASRFSNIFSGGGVRARALRASALTLMNFGGSKALRLVSNLALTRILFPEAFGLMALVQVFLAGLQMFSDVGLNTSIIQNKRGDEPDFLNTAWTLQIIRGVLLWLGACALAIPAAQLYNEPMLAYLLPVAGFTSVIGSFKPTKVATANRHLKLGRQTALDLISQALGIVIMVALALMMESVWSLVIGALIGRVVFVTLLWLYIPGAGNRLLWEPKAVREMFHFGKFIFLGTVAGFIINQGDRAVLGKFISLYDLGIYNIAMFLGTLPFLLVMALTSKIVMPLYRMKPPIESDQNRAKIHQARRLISTAVLSLSFVMAFGGIALIEFMYDPRYALAGPMVVLFSLAIVPQVVFNGYEGALLSAGDSKRHFLLLTVRAALQVVLLIVLVKAFGIFGAICAGAIASLMTWPLRVALVHRYRANDHIGDAVFLTLGFTINGFACWLYWDEILKILA